MKGMLDGLFKFLKFEKHVKKTYPSHGLFSHLGEGKCDGLFNFIESKRRIQKTPRGSFFVNLVPLGRKRDNLSREYSSNQLRIRAFLLCS